MPTDKTDDVRLIDIPYIPPQIPLDKLFDDYGDGRLRLLPKAEVEFWEMIMSTLPNRRYSKGELDLHAKRAANRLGLYYPPRYGMIKDDKGLVVVYEGRRAEEREQKTNEHTKRIVGAGAYGVVKFMQYTKTGEISVLKISNMLALKRTKLDLDAINNLISMLNTTNQKVSKKDLKKRDQLQKRFDKLKVILEEIDHLKKAGLLNFSYEHLSKDKSTSEDRSFFVHETLIGMKFVGRNNLYDELSVYVEGKKNPNYNDSLSPLQYLQIMNNIAKATEEIHQLRIIHRDIKSDNYRIDPATGEVKLIDFGFAVYVPDGRLEFSSEHFKGTPLFSPPEHLKESTFFKKETKTFNNGTDTYSMLMTIAEALDLVVDGKPIEFKGKKFSPLRLLTEKDPEFTEKFTNNRRLPADPDLRKEILTFLQIATAPVSKENPQRLTSEEVVRFFDSVYKRAIKQEDEVEKFRVATVSVEEFLEDPQKMIQRLKQQPFNAIALTDIMQGRTTKEYAQVQQMLSEAGIKNIAPKVFFGINNDSVNNRVREFYQEKFNVRPPIYNFSNARQTFVRQQEKAPAPVQSPAVQAQKTTTPAAWAPTKPSTNSFKLFKQNEAAAAAQKQTATQTTPAQKQTTAAQKPEAHQAVVPWARTTPTKRH